MENPGSKLSVVGEVFRLFPASDNQQPTTNNQQPTTNNQLDLRNLNDTQT
jgi:hypothetical protein